MKKLILVIVSLFALILAGCAPATPQVDVAADEVAIREAFDGSTAALNANDGSIVKFRTNDAVIMSPNSPAVIGMDAIKERHEALYSQAAFEGSWSVDEVVVSGDWAFVRWASKGTVTPKDGGEPSEFDRKGITIFQRQPDNSWKGARAIWNPNLPAAE